MQGLIDTHFHLDMYKDYNEIYKIIVGKKQYTLCMTNSPGVFLSCKNLSSINVVSDNNYFSSIDGVLFNKNQTAIVQYPEGKNGNSYVIPSSVTAIGTGAFKYAQSLTNIVIPSSVTAIGLSAFDNCKSLTSITIPDSVTTIGN